MKDNKILISFIIGITLLLNPFFVMLATAQDIKQLVNGSDSETILVISPDDYVPQDKFWPIIKRDIQSYVDPETGLKVEHETIWRQAPEGISSTFPDNQNCNEFLNADGEVGITATCAYQGNLSRTDKVRINKNSTYIEAILITYAYKYCPSTGCAYMDTYYDMYQMDASWYRSSTKWTAKEAKFTWGCPVPSCKTCGSDYTLGLRNGDIVSVVAWATSNKSMVYQITYPSFPQMTARWEGAYPVSKTTSKAYFENVYISPIMTPTVTWTE